MSAVPEVNSLSQSDLTDSIAEALPPNLRAAYYRELIHCRSLPDTDEMLRVIRILQILTYLIQQAPAAVATEREKIGALVGSLTDALHRTTQSICEHHSEVDRRLIELPEDLAKRIQPAVIAKEISESVHQEFARSGLLELGQGFQASSAKLEKLLARLNTMMTGFESSLTTIEQQISNAGRGCVQAMHHTRDTLIHEGERLADKYWWPRCVLAGVVIVMVFMLGMRYARWLDPTPAANSATIAPPTEQPIAPPAAQPKPRLKGR